MDLIKKYENKCFNVNSVSITMLFNYEKNALVRKYFIHLHSTNDIFNKRFLENGIEITAYKFPQLDRTT